MRRREFLKGSLPAAAATGVMLSGTAGLMKAAGKSKHPRAITMWEFSWIERRWPGAGYEDWDKALDELKDRGYDAVRIDPFPHLLATDPHKTWTLLPEWNTQDWGSPDVNRIVLLPALTEFIGKCRARGIKVGLSTWYREDEDKTRLKISGPEMMADQWIKTLDTIASTIKSKYSGQKLVIEGYTDATPPSPQPRATAKIASAWAALRPATPTARLSCRKASVRSCAGSGTAAQSRPSA